MKINRYNKLIIVFLMWAFSAASVSAIQSVPPPGVYHEPVSITLSSPEPGVEIRYTIDNQDPTLTDSLYSAPIAVKQTTAIKAREYYNGTASGDIFTLFYVFIDSSLRNFTSDLPLAVVDNFGAGEMPINDNMKGGEEPVEKQHAFIAVFEREGSKTTLTQAPSLCTNIGIKVRGSSSSSFPKKSYSMESWDQTGADHDIAPLSLPPEEDWILFGSRKYDQAFVRNQLIFEAYRRLGYWAPRWKFIELFLNVDGGNVSMDDYLGIYLLMEKIKRDDNRVNIDKLKPTHSTAPDITGGYILKIDRLDPQPAEGFRTAHGVPSVTNSVVNFVEPPWEDITEPQKTWIRKYLDDFENVLYEGNNDPSSGYPAYIDVRSFIDYMIFNDLSKNPDGLRFSTFMYKPRGEKLRMGPVWDFDRTMDSYDGRDNSADTAYNLRDQDWYGELFKDEWFFEQYKYRWNEIRRSHSLRTSFVDSLLDSWSVEMEDAKPREEQAWDYKKGITYEINYLKTWVKKRSEWLDSQYVSDGSPVVFPSGTSRVPEHLQISTSGKFLHVKITGRNGACLVSIYSMTGRSFFRHRKKTSELLTINTRAWPGGMYIVNIHSSQFNVCKKLVIAH